VMATSISEVMTRDPVTASSETPVVEVARIMRDRDIGPVVVVDGGSVRGIVTDRDIVLRGVAEGKDLTALTVAEVCSGDVEAVSPDDTVESAVSRMQAADVRRLPVVDGQRVVGIVSMGDLAVEEALPASAIADISAASPNN
jgi:CBS domain-containing protein